MGPYLPLTLPAAVAVPVAVAVVAPVPVAVAVVAPVAPVAPVAAVAAPPAWPAVARSTTRFPGRWRWPTVGERRARPGTPSGPGLGARFPDSQAVVTR